MPDDSRHDRPDFPSDEDFDAVEPVLATAAKVREVIPPDQAVAMFFFGRDGRVHFVHNTVDADQALATIRAFLDATEGEAPQARLAIPHTS